MPYIYNHHAGWRLIVSVVHQKQIRRLRSRSFPTLPTFWTERWSMLGIFILGPFGCLSGEATLPNSVSFQNKHTNSFVYIYRYGPYIHIYVKICLCLEWPHAHTPTSAFVLKAVLFALHGRNASKACMSDAKKGPSLPPFFAVRTLLVDCLRGRRLHIAGSRTFSRLLWVHGKFTTWCQ